MASQKVTQKAKTIADFSMAEFNFLLGQSPPLTAERDGIPYIPIATIDQLLDEIFLGLWSTKTTRFERIHNQIVCTTQLRVFHPIAKIWITRTGSGASQIQQFVGRGEKKDPTDLSTMGLSTLEKDFPRAVSMARSNAAKTLGPIFGRNLNKRLAHIKPREDESVYVAKLLGLIQEAEQSIESVEATAMLKRAFDNFGNIPGVAWLIQDQRDKLKTAEAKGRPIPAETTPAKTTPAETPQNTPEGSDDDLENTLADLRTDALKSANVILNDAAMPKAVKVEAIESLWEQQHDGVKTPEFQGAFNAIYKKVKALA